MESVSWWTELRGAFRVATFGNSCLMMAMVIGFFHGWIKRTYPGVLGTFAYDIPLVLGLISAWFSVPARKSFFPDSRVATALKAVFVIVIFYSIIPTDVPLLIRLASVRGWLFIPLMFLVGYHILRTPRQLVWLGRLILLLCIVTTIYGMRQNPDEILRNAAEDVGLMRTLNGATYQAADGGGGFRVFSTFVGAGMFATALGFGIMIGLAEVTEPGRVMISRLPVALAVAFSVYGILISGTRSYVIISLAAALVIAWLRRKLFQLMPLMLGLGFVTFLIVDALKLMDSSRILSVFSIQEIWARAYIVFAPALECILENPLGEGIAYSTHGIPVILESLVRNNYVPIQIDGDLGHAAVDFGLVGMVAYSLMMIRATQDCIFWTRSQREVDAETVGILATTFSIVAVLGFVTGSPFLHVPTGSVIWFYIGGLNRCYDDRRGVKDLAKRGIPRSQIGGLSAPQSSKSPLIAESMTEKPSSTKPVRPRRFLYG